MEAIKKVPRKTARRWTPEEDAALIAGHGKVRMKILAHQIGRPINGLWSRAVKLKLVRKQRKWTPEETARCRQLVRRMSAREAGEILGRTRLAVQHHMWKHRMVVNKWRPPASHPWRKAASFKYRSPKP